MSINSEGMPAKFERANIATTLQDFVYKIRSQWDLQEKVCSRSFFADSEDGILIRGEVCDDSGNFIIIY